jgi:hypothetical protein
VQPIDHAGLDEARERNPSTLDEDAAVTFSAKSGEDGGRFEAVLAKYRQKKNIPLRTHMIVGCPADHQRPGCTVSENVPLRLQPAVRVENDSDWIRAFDVPHCQTRVVGGDRAGADDDGVDNGAKAMEPLDISRAGNVMGVALLCGNSTVEALSDLGDHEVGLELEWKVQLDQLTCLVSYVVRSYPVSGSVDLQPHIGSGIMTGT